jgi:branched-chain amino acid transport system permease protein
VTAQRPSLNNLLAIALTAAAAAYVLWKISQSPEQAVQFAFNGLSVGAVYALLAIGFTLVYSTVWYFDLYYGAAAALGAYGVFYLRSQETLGGLYAVNSILVNVIFAAATAGVVAWALYESVYPRFRSRVDRSILLGSGGALAAVAGVYTAFVLTNPKDLHIFLSPVIALGVAALATWGLYQAYQGVVAGRVLRGLVVVTGAAAAGLGVYCAYLIANTPDAKLYLSWGVSCFLAGVVGLALYRGLYVYMRARSQSPLTMLVASLGILLAMTALTSIVFESTPRPLPEALGNQPWTLAGATIKGFNVFTIGVAVVGFLFLLALLKRTAFGKAVRAIGDDEEVSKVVGINTTTVIAVVFFIGAVYAAMAGILSGHDTAIQPRMGLLLLLKGWIASVVGGIGNLNGAIVGGFVLGMIEQFGIWDLAGEWRDVISFVLLILFLSFWPKGLLPRK